MMENLQFRTWLNEIDVSLIMAAAAGTKLLYLQKMLRGVLEYGKRIHDDDVSAITGLFQNLFNKRTADVSDALPFGSTQSQWAKDLYQFVDKRKF